MSDPLEAPRKLGRAVRAAASAIGLDLVTFGVMPGPQEEDGDYVDAVFRIRTEGIMTEEELEARRIDQEFEAIASGFEIIEEGVSSELAEKLREISDEDFEI